MGFVKSNQRLKYYKKEVSKDYFIIEKNIIFAGTHIILDLWNCSFSNKIVSLKKIIKEAANLSKANILHMHMHRFGKEQGISGIAILAESHISVHTWPERDYMAFDIFMCGNTKPNLAVELNKKEIKSVKSNLKVFKRVQIE